MMKMVLKEGQLSRTTTINRSQFKMVLIHEVGGCHGLVLSRARVYVCVGCWYTPATYVGAI